MEDTKNKFEITYRNVDELVEPDYNPRKITAKQKEDIRKSIERFGSYPFGNQSAAERINLFWNKDLI